jgi:hypothetical protein
MVNNQKILFVHIPKNLGRTIQLVFGKYKTNSIAGHIDLHQFADLTSIQEMVSADFILFVSRDPYRRAVSLYNYFRNHAAREHGHRLEHDYFLKNNFIDSLLYVSSNVGNPQRLTENKYGSTSSFLMTKNQKTYVDLDFILDPETKNNLERKKICLRFENIERDLDLFLDQLGVPNVEKDVMLKQLAKGGSIFKSNVSKADELTINEIELIKKIYKEDLMWTKQ